MSHRVNYAKKSVGKCHTCKALSVMHGRALIAVAVIGVYKILLYHLDGMKRERIGKVAVCSRYISLNGVSHGIHAGVSNQLLRHGFGQIGVNNCNIGSNLEIGKGILYALFIIGYNRKCRNFGGSAGSGGDGHKTSLGAKGGETKNLAHILKGGLGIFVFNPHCLGCINGGAAAHSNDPVGLEFGHSLSSAHYGVYGRIGLYAFENFNFHTGFLQIAYCAIKKTELLHASAANADHSFAAFKLTENFESTFAVINISGKGKTRHNFSS